MGPSAGKAFTHSALKSSKSLDSLSDQLAQTTLSIDDPASSRRVDPTFAAGMRRFLPQGRAYFLYGERDHFWEELRFALDRLRAPADRCEIELVPGEIDSFRSIAMQSVTHDRVTAWCRRIAETLRDGA